MSELSLTTAEAISRQYLANPPAGRYSELADPDVITTIFDAISAGLNAPSACEAAGIHPNTFRKWQQRAELEPLSAYGAFNTELKRLRRVGQVTLLKRIAKASEKEQHWTAAAWICERTDPDQFALKKEDAAVPRVVVNIGASNSDVKVQVIAGACQDPGTTLNP